MESQSDLWNRRVRMMFWAFGLIAGGVLTYTSRYYINSDAIVYIEMGEMFVNGRWDGLVNLTFSPAYAVLMGVAQILLHTNPLNELIILRLVSFFCFFLTMIGCDLMMEFVGRELNDLSTEQERPLPSPLVNALCYAMLLIAALLWVRLRLMNPDMLMIFHACMGISILLWIRQDPQEYRKFALLGAVAAAGYLTKAYFWLFAPMLFLIAGLHSGSLRRAVPRVVVAVGVMAVLIAPYVWALSEKKGGFTFGEGGRHVYADRVAGKGEPIYLPKPLHSNPNVTVLSADQPGTWPLAHDVTYWTVGVRPAYDPRDHIPYTLKNALAIFDQTPWLIGVLVWFAYLWWVGSFRLGSWIPLSLPLTLLLPAVYGIGIFCLVLMEPRYVAPFFYLAFVGVMTGLRCRQEPRRSCLHATYAMLVLLAVFGGLIVHAVIDQTTCGLYSAGSKPTWRESYFEQWAVRDYLARHGARPGDRVAVIGQPPIYWARFGGQRILGQVTGPEFISATQMRRKQAVESLRAAGFKALVAYGSAFGRFNGEGWNLVPGTRAYYVRILNPSETHQPGKIGFLSIPDVRQENRVGPT